MGVLLNLTKEYFNKGIRSEEGISVKINGKTYMFKHEDHDYLKNLIPLNDKGDLFVEKTLPDIFENPIYLCCAYYPRKNKYSNDFYEYHYYTKDFLDNMNDNVVIDEPDVWTTSNYDIFSDNLLVFEIIQNTIEDIELNDENTIYKYDDYYTLEQSYLREIHIYTNHKQATDEAVEKCKDSYKENFEYSMPKKDFISLRDTYGDDWIDYDELKSSVSDYFNYEYTDEIKNEEGKHGNKLIDELIDYGLVEDTADFFETDHNNPNFSLGYVSGVLIEHIMKDKNVSEDEAVSMIEKMDNEEIIENCIKYEIITDDEGCFSLNYSSPKFDIDEVAETLADKKADEVKIMYVDNIVNLYLSQNKDVDSTIYNLEELAKKDVERNGRGYYLDKERKERKYKKDDIEYLVYVIKDKGLY